MALRPLVLYPDPLLKERSVEVTEFDEGLFTLLDEMAETMYSSRGIGLAAPQIGVLRRVAVVDVSPDGDELIELVNPVIVAESGKVPSEEGCLSIPDYRDTIERKAAIKVHAVDRNSRAFELEADDLLAICIQHEIDHLDGVLFVDRLSRLKREFFKRWFRKRSEGRE